MLKIRNVVFAMAVASAMGGCMVDGEEGLADVGTAESEIVFDGPVFGGSTGIPFHTNNYDPNDKIVGVTIRSAREIDGFTVRYASGRVEKFGGNGGDENQEFLLFPGEELVAIYGHSGARVDSLWLITSTGRVSQKYGGDGGENEFSYWIPAGAKVLGFQGRHKAPGPKGDRIHAIGLVGDR